jgi:hypothetical protein
LKGGGESLGELTAGLSANLAEIATDRKEKVTQTLNEALVPFFERPDGSIAVCGGAVVISSPFNAGDCSGNNEIVLSRIRSILQG